MKLIFTLLSTLCITTFFSCSEILQPDVSDGDLNILTPRDSLVSNTNTQSFFWETSIIDPQCRIQIVKPSFDQIDYFIEDTLVTGNQFEITLTPDLYAWRIRLENDHSTSEYQYFTLFVDSSTNLTDLVLRFSYPIKNQFLSIGDSFNISWEPLADAQQYEYIIENLTNGLSSQLVTNSTQAQITLGEGFYSAKIRGQGIFTNTLYAETNFAIDTTAPSSITGIFPVNNHIFPSSNVSLNWAPPSDEISPEHDSIFFYSDISGNSLISKKRLNSSFLDTTLSGGIYYWSIQRVDQVGFKGPKNNPQRFFVQ